jgi:hypothetical protein
VPERKQKKHIFGKDPKKRLCLVFESVSDNLVPKEGLEPSYLAVLAPKASVSTNFTTWATVKVLINKIKHMSKSYKNNLLIFLSPIRTIGLFLRTFLIKSLLDN